MSDVHIPFDPFWSLVDEEIDRQCDLLAAERDPDEDLWLDESDLLPPTWQWEDEELYDELEPFDYDELGRIMHSYHECDPDDGYVDESDYDPIVDESIQIGKQVFWGGTPEDKGLGFEPIYSRRLQLHRRYQSENGTSARRSDIKDRYDTRSGKGQTHYRKVWARQIDRHNTYVNWLLASNEPEAVAWRDKILELDRKLKEREVAMVPEWCKRFPPMRLSREATRIWYLHKERVQAAVWHEQDRQAVLEREARFDDLERQRELQAKRETGMTDREIYLLELELRMLAKPDPTEEDREGWEQELNETESGRRYRDYREGRDPEPPCNCMACRIDRGEVDWDEDWDEDLLMHEDVA